MSGTNFATDCASLGGNGQRRPVFHVRTFEKKTSRVENRFFIWDSFAFDVLKTAMASFGSHRLTLKRVTETKSVEWDLLAKHAVSYTQD